MSQVNKRKEEKKDNKWHFCRKNKDGTIVIQNDTTYEVNVLKDGKVIKAYIPK
jgi:hypothetical protein